MRGAPNESMTTRHRAAILTAALALTLLLAGCGDKSVENTPEAIAKAFADAIADGDVDSAAKLCDYIAEARKSNEDWDDIPSGQRSQIIRKLQELKQGELQGLASLFGSGMEVGQTNASGSTAGVTLTGGPAGSVVMMLVESDGQWGVVGVTQGQ